MKEVIAKVRTGHNGKKISPGDAVSLPEETAKVWVQNGWGAYAPKKAAPVRKPSAAKKKAGSDG